MICLGMKPYSMNSQFLLGIFLLVTKNNNNQLSVTGGYDCILVMLLRPSWNNRLEVTRYSVPTTSHKRKLILSQQTWLAPKLLGRIRVTKCWVTQKACQVRLRQIFKA